MIGYRWYEKKGIKPLFPFGHGLSYTNFNWNFGVVPIFGSAFSTSGTGSGTSFSGQSFTINSISTSGVNITNTTNSAQVFKFSVIPRFSSNALF